MKKVRFGSVSAGERHSVFVAIDGRAWSAGDNTANQCGPSDFESAGGARAGLGAGYAGESGRSPGKPPRRPTRSGSSDGTLAGLPVRAPGGASCCFTPRRLDETISLYSTGGGRR